MTSRRQFISLLGGATAVWPMAAQGQQPAMPVVGYLGATSMSASPRIVAAFRQGLKDGGYVEGQNVKIEFRWAENQPDRLQSLATELVNRQVAVVFGGGPPAALAAKAATQKSPVVFTSGEDPVKIGLVSSLNRPGGNVTGISILFQELEAKRLELLRAVVPTAGAVGFVFDPGTSSQEAEAAAQRLGLRLYGAPVASEDQLDAVFAALVEHKVDAFLLGRSPRFSVWRQRILGLALRTALPAMYEARDYVTDGGLMSYGANPADAYRLAGNYVARILQGEKPADLPVVQPTKFEFVINLKTAKTLGLIVPPMVLALADEVIE